MRLHWFSWAILLLAFVSSGRHAPAQTEAGTVRVDQGNRRLIGQPLAWDGRELALLRRDGRMTLFPVTSDQQVVSLSSTFTPYTRDQLKLRLEREFGSRYQVSATEHLLVVHPPGGYDTWARPFQDSLWRFRDYFESRGFRLQNPQFPLIAVVLGTREEFDRFLKDYHQPSPQMIGYYSVTSNRIITYAPPAAPGESLSGYRQAAVQATLIHEGAHQAAFNLGIHSRMTPNSQWVTEGLATLFEAPGVHHGAHNPSQSDRINPAQLARLQKAYRNGEIQEVVPKLILSDDLFRSDPELAYAAAWGMTFFLSETMPSKYQQYLQQDARRTPFKSYSASQRAVAFSSAFGSDLAGLEARMRDFFSGLNVPSNR